MSPRDKALWLSVQRKASTLSPSMAREVLAAYRVIRESLNDVELARLITSGQLEQIIDAAVLDRAFVPLRDRIIAATRKGFQSAALPPSVEVAFNILNPRVLDAVRALDTRVIQTLKNDVRDIVKAFVENGIRDGDGPRTIARELRAVIGMSPTQAANAAKYEAKLTEEGKYSDAQVEKMVATYRRKAIALNAETNARTATLDSLKLGQKLSIDDAVANGALDPSRLTKTWVGVLDDRERDSHIAMEGETVPYDQQYSNGQMIPGESEYNCRCISRFSQAR